VYLPISKSIRVVGIAAVVAALGATMADAASGAVTATGPSGAVYNLDITCATKSATARVSLNAAKKFHGYTIVDNLGQEEPFELVDSHNRPVATGAQDAALSTLLHSNGASYRLDEIPLTGADQPVIPALSTTDCPTYAAAGAAFTPITPTRLLDTRPATAIGYSGPKPGINSTVDLQVTGAAGIPANAVAVTLNVTMTEASGPGYVQVYPSGVGTPGTSSNINAEAAGQTIPNSVTVPVGNGGKVTLYTSAGAHLIADVSGYFVNVTGPVSAGRFTGITPKRILDTRPATQVNFTAAKPGPAATVRINPVLLAGLPKTAVGAVALNVTATEADAAGYVQVAAAGSLVPGASSNLNLSGAGQTIPNMVIVPVSANGEIDLYTLQSTHLVVDVLGWFTNSTVPASTSGLFVPMTPERVLDTRADTAVNYSALRIGTDDSESKPAANDTIRFDLVGIPAAGGSALLNLTAANAVAPGFVQGAALGALSPGSSSNVNVDHAGQTIANAALLPVASNGGVVLYTQTSTDLIADIGGFFRA